MKNVLFIYYLTDILIISIKWLLKVSLLKIKMIC